MEEEEKCINDITEEEWAKLWAMVFKKNDTTKLAINIDARNTFACFGPSNILEIDTRTGKAIAHIIKSNSNINSIHIEKCTLSEEATTAIIGAIESNTSISSITFLLSEFDCEISLAIGYILGNITNLVIEGCGASIMGSATIGKALKSNSTPLTSLALNPYDQQSNEASKVIFESLRSNHSLTNLHLSYFCCGINDISNLGNNCILSSVKLFQCGIDDNGAAVLANVLSTNTSLVSVELCM